MTAPVRDIPLLGTGISHFGHDGLSPSYFHSIKIVLSVLKSIGSYTRRESTWLWAFHMSNIAMYSFSPFFRM